MGMLETQTRLLKLIQPVNAGNQPPELRSVEDFVNILLAGEKSQREPPRSLRHLQRFAQGSAAFGNHLHCLRNCDSQAANLARLFVNLFARRKVSRGFGHRTHFCYYKACTKMQQSNPKTGDEPFIVVFEAEDPSEAIVLRSLLESAGIESPQPSYSDPFPGAFSGVFTHDTSILALASKAEDARLLIASKSK